MLDGEDADLLERKEEYEQDVLNSNQEALGWVLKTKGESAVAVFQVCGTKKDWIPSCESDGASLFIIAPRALSIC